jgi:hypothetical protein
MLPIDPRYLAPVAGRVPDSLFEANVYSILVSLMIWYLDTIMPYVLGSSRPIKLY